MRSKKFLLLIATLLLFTVSLAGCCISINSDEKYGSNDIPRFTSQRIEISGDAEGYFDYTFILIDNQTGKQYLYTHDDGGATMVEIGTIELNTETSTVTNE